FAAWCTTFCFSSFFFSSYYVHRHLHSFPTRRSSDLAWRGRLGDARVRSGSAARNPSCAAEALVRSLFEGRAVARAEPADCEGARDRKSTRLNSSHVKISYAVFCLKKKKIDRNP